MDILLDKVKEKGIVKQIIEYKINMEDWDIISKYPLYTYIQNSDLTKYNWNLISIKENLQEDFILRYSNYVEWDMISKYQNLSDQFIINNSDLLFWYYISMKKLSLKVIEKNKNRILLNKN